MKFPLQILLFYVLCINAQNTDVLDNIFVTQSEIKSAIIGVCVKDVHTKTIIFEKNAHYQLTPASTLKLLTTIAALEKLGSSFQFKTEIYYSGKISNRTLYGTLIIKGYGDPTIDSRFFSTPTLQNFVQILKNKGIEKIEGHIVIDNSYFQPQINDNWAWEDINNYYASAVHPINIYDNEYHLYFQTNANGQPAHLLKIFPQYYTPPYIEIVDCQVVAQQGGDNAFIYGDPLQYLKRVEGSIPPYQKEYSIEGALPNPPRMFGEQLLKTFRNSGISVSSSSVILIKEDTLNYTHCGILGTVLSPTLAEIVKQTNMHSINLFAEAMVYAIGKGNYTAGKKTIMNMLSQNTELYISDGCGLSRTNGVSASALCEWLVYAYHKPYQQVLLNSLPVAGESGTMKKFSDTSPLKGNLMCKTGYIERVRTYAGYMQSKSGKTLAVVLMYNNFNTSTEKIKQITKMFFETLWQNF